MGAGSIYSLEQQPLYVISMDIWLLILSLVCFEPCGSGIARLVVTGCNYLYYQYYEK